MISKSQSMVDGFMVAGLAEESCLAAVQEAEGREENQQQRGRDWTQSPRSQAKITLLWPTQTVLY